MRIFLFSLLMLVDFMSGAQPSIEWHKTIGGSGLEMGLEVIQTKDGGWLYIGRSSSMDLFDSSTTPPVNIPLHGFDSDMFAVKVNKLGNIEWQKLIGSSQLDFFTSGLQTNDGGYILVGTNLGLDGDVAGAINPIEYCIIKLNAEGTIQWKRFYGGAVGDVPEDIVQTQDGGFVISGFAYSFDGDVTGNHGANDAWIIKINAIGELIWQKCLGGGNHDYSLQLLETEAGDIMVAGSTNSTDGDVFGTHGWDDYWLIKLNRYGDFQWQRCYGGSQRNELNDFVQANDGGFVISGYSASTDGDIHNPILKYDYWVVKVNSTGDIVWEKSYGGEEDDGAKNNVSDDSRVSIDRTKNGGYIIAGSTRSYAGDISGNHGKSDIWLVAIDSTGKKLWQKCLGGSENEYNASVIQTPEGGFMVLGYSNSNDGDLAGVMKDTSNVDIWVVKLSPVSLIDGPKKMSIGATLFPNPTEGPFQLRLPDLKTGRTQIIRFEIRNLDGKLVKSGTANRGDNGNFNLDVTELAPGFYFLTGDDPEVSFSQKLIIY